MTTGTQTIQKGYKQTEIGVIPTDWEIKQLGDVGEIRMCRRIFNHETKEKGAIPFYKIGTFGNEADAYIPEDLYDNYRRRFSFPKKGAVLISAAGTIGRTIVYDGSPAYFQDSNIIWIDNNEKLISNSYLYYVLQIAKYNTEGGTIQRLYNNILNSTKFICPLKPEQSAIATVLSDTDSLIRKLESLVEKKKNIKQGAMQELLNGRRRLPGFSSQWDVKKINDFTYCTAGGTPSTLIPSYWGGDIKWMSSGELNNKKITDVEGRITEKGLKESGTKSVPAGCVLVGLAGQGKTRGTTAINRIDLCINQSIAAILPSSNHDSNYLYYNFDNRYDEIRGLSTGGEGRGGLNLSIIGEILVKFPPKPEQIAIAKVLSDMDAEIEKLESQLTKYQNLKQGMMQMLLTGKIRLLTK